MVIETANQAVATIPAGWAQVLNSPQGTGTAGGTAATRVTVLWKRATSSTEATLSIGDSGNHQVAQIFVFRGVVNTGNPWDVTAGNTTGVTTTAVTIPGATTTVANTLVLTIVMNVTDTTTAQTSGWTNGNLTNFAEIGAFNNSVGNGGGFGVAAGEKVTAGAYGNTTATLATASVQARMSIALRPGVITLGTGTDPGNVTIAPSAAATLADSFTVQTNVGTNGIDDVTVDLGAGNSAGIGLVEITNNAGTVVYGSVANPATDTPTIILSTNTLTATTTLTQYRIRITPLSHAAMPVPPGATYAVTAKINAFTSTYRQTGSDAAGTTVTIDNQSPGNVTAASCSAGSGQISLAWTNPADADFNSAIVLRRAGTAVGDTPVEGTTYAGGNTIGSSTVACVVASPGTSCTDSGLTMGTLYHYKAFSKDSNGNYAATGVVPSGSPCTTQPSTFNAVEPGASASGNVFTKIAGQNMPVDVVARDGAGNLVGFTGTVAVEVVDATTGGGVCASMTQIAPFTNQTFASGEGGRHPLSSPNSVANSYPNARFRIKYPAGSPTITNCSVDNFAIRPNNLVITRVSDTDALNPGTTRALTNVGATGGTVHKAGRSFTISVTAQNFLGATTSNYAGSPASPTLSACIGTGCTGSFGTLTPGAWSADPGPGANGSVVTNAATYSDVGAFRLQVEDRTFADVDASDGSSTTDRYIVSTTFDVGRFVPDHFTLSASGITNRDGLGCSPASIFTYMSEGITLALTLQAHQNPSGVTPNYAGTLAKLDPASVAAFAFAAKSGSTVLTSRISASTSGSWSAGSTAVAGTLQILRNAAPDGPYSSLRFGIAPVDADGVGMDVLDVDLDASAGTDHKAIGSATEVRFGRLRQQSAVASSGALVLPVPITLQYWNGSAFTTNSDDICTTISTGSVTLSGASFTPAGSTSVSSVTFGTGAAAGTGTIRLAAPGAANHGFVLVTPSLPGYLQGNWTGSTWDQNPSARAAWGVFGSQPQNFIFQRENY